MGKKILIVDDDPKELELLTGYLKVWEYEIITALDGKTALEIANDQKIDLVLLDAVMPDIDGFEVCKRLKANEKTKFLPVLIITSLIKEYRLLAINLGADEFLSKPIDKVELNVRVNSLLKTKSLHDQLEENYEKLEKLVKLKDDLSNTITHDINNLLGVIKNFLDLLSAKKETLTKSINEGLTIAMGVSNDLAYLISDFMDIQKMEESKLTLHLERTSVSDLIRDAVKKMEPIAGNAKVQLIKRDISQQFYAMIDKRLISRVLINLIINGIRSTPPGGSVEVELTSAEDALNVLVRDTGVGVLPEHQEIIFEKFVKIDNNAVSPGKGKGLGLAFCKLAVETHGGKIWVESEGRNKGSAFIFTLSGN